jgi:concanavalin A-like lectin/glucanase superfamily protein
MLQYQDTGLTPGSTHTYTYTASDGPHTTAKSPASAAVTVASSSPTQTYQQSVLSDSPSFLWPLNETSGSTATDASSHNFNGIYEGGTTQGVAGPITGTSATAFNGSSGNVAASSTVNNPQTFSIEAWFKTSANTGGKIVGFGNQQTGASSNYDRHIYMMNDGQLTFGVYNNKVSAIQSPGVYNDGQWHYVVATLSSAGMKLYVDSQLVASNSSVTTAQAYSGYWRVGGDNLSGGWNLDPWGSVSQGTTQPYSYYFNGSIADVAVYPTALSSAQIGAHYAAALQQNN